MWPILRRRPGAAAICRRRSPRPTEDPPMLSPPLLVPVRTGFAWEELRFPGELALRAEVENLPEFAAVAQHGSNLDAARVAIPWSGAIRVSAGLSPALQRLACT